jgi:hypothetical protein
MDIDLSETSAQVRTIYKLVKDTSRTAYDVLPCGRTLGEYANVIAVDRYIKKNWRKRHQARAARASKKNGDARRRPSSAREDSLGENV